MTMHYTYLTWSLLLLAIWGGVFVANRTEKKKMLFVSVSTMPLGLTEPLFYPEYWFPPTLFDLAAQTGLDVESLIFSFSVGGLASALYGIGQRTDMELMPECTKRQKRHRFHKLALASPILAFIPMFIFSELNAIYIASISMAVGGLATVLCRPDLFKRMIWSASIFGGLYFLFFASMSWSHPDLVSLYWNNNAISGWAIVGVPVEELLFAVTFGFMWGGLYEHLGWYGSIRT